MFCDIGEELYFSAVAVYSMKQHAASCMQFT